MGHYYADMMCNTCGQVRCRCIQLSKKDPTEWMVEPYTFKVLTVAKYDEAQGKKVVMKIGSMEVTKAYLNTNGIGDRVMQGIKSFVTKKEAEAFRNEILLQACKVAHMDVQRLERLCNKYRT